MKYIRIIGFVVVISLTVYNGVSFAQTGTETIPPTTIELSVTAKGDLKYLIQSYMKRELKNLGNVKIHDYLTPHSPSQNKDFDDYLGYIPDWEIAIVAIEPTTKKNRKLGSLIMSVVILRNYETYLDSVNLSAMEKFKLEHHLLSKVVLHKLLINPSINNLQRICSGIVAEFDIEYSPVTTQEDIEKIRYELEKELKGLALFAPHKRLKRRPKIFDKSDDIWQKKKRGAKTDQDNDK